jgi:hypothetical protein
MTDCVQNLIIFLLIIILFYGAHAYMHNKKRKSNRVNSILNNAIEENKVVVVYPINNNLNNLNQHTEMNKLNQHTEMNNLNQHTEMNKLNELNNLNDLNELHHEYVPDDNIILIEENKVVTGDNFNYDKTINNVLNGFDPDDKYLSVN